MDFLVTLTLHWLIHSSGVVGLDFGPAETRQKARQKASEMLSQFT